jgi:predicted ester cyclase
MEFEPEVFARAWVDALNGADSSRLRALCHPAIAVHAVTPVRSSLPPGADRVLAFVDAWRGLFPDARFSVRHVEWRKQLLVCHVQSEGALAGASARVTVDGRFRFRIADHKVNEHWIEIDRHELMSRLGLLLPAPGQGAPLSAADCRALAERWIDAFVRRDGERLAELCDPHVVLHLGEQRSTSGVALLGAALDQIHAALSQLDYRIRNIIVQGATITCRGIVTGRQDGSFLGVRASGTVESHDMHFMLRVADGLVAEVWGSAHPRRRPAAALAD